MVIEESRSARTSTSETLMQCWPSSRASVCACVRPMSSNGAGRLPSAPHCRSSKALHTHTHTLSLPPFPITIAITATIVSQSAFQRVKIWQGKHSLPLTHSFALCCYKAHIHPGSERQAVLTISISTSTSTTILVPRDDHQRGVHFSFLLLIHLLPLAWARGCSLARRSSPPTLPSLHPAAAEIRRAW